MSCHDVMQAATARLSIGLGFREGSSAAQIEAAMRHALQAASHCAVSCGGMQKGTSWGFADIACVATLDEKTGHPGLQALCERFGLPLRGYGREVIAAFVAKITGEITPGPAAAFTSGNVPGAASRTGSGSEPDIRLSAPSPAVAARFGLPGICEPCALLTLLSCRLLLPKTALAGVTVAIAIGAVPTLPASGGAPAVNER